MRSPEYETKRFAFYLLRVGATIVRKRDNRSVYFQPGDDTAAICRDVSIWTEHDEMTPGENDHVFDSMCDDYFA